MNLLTRRFPTILGMILLILGIAGGWWYFDKNKPLVSEEFLPNQVRITNVADNKFTVSWTTTEASKGFVEYGAVGEKLGQIVYDDRDTEGSQAEYATHHITVDGLQPETQYAFRILSGSKSSRFDNNGTPYSVTTGPTIASAPASKSFYGEVVNGAGNPGTGAIVYLGLPGAAPASTLVTSSANYSFTLSTIRTADLQKYIEYDPSATIVNVTAVSGTTESLVSVTTADSDPVPTIILGQNADFTSGAQLPIAQIEPADQAPDETPETTETVPETPGIFNVQPLEGSSNVSTGGDVILLNPSKEGEQLATAKPEFRGMGPEDTVLSITVRSVKPVNDTVIVGNDGTWSWTPAADLAPGEHTVTIAYIDEAGFEQSLVRKFFVSAALAAEGDPAFVATPSATTKASPSVKASATPSPSPSAIVNYAPTTSISPSASSSAREIIPSTESGVPVTGVISPTLLTGALGLVIMVLGALLLAL